MEMYQMTSDKAGLRLNTSPRPDRLRESPAFLSSTYRKSSFPGKTSSRDNKLISNLQYVDVKTSGALPPIPHHFLIITSPLTLSILHAYIQYTTIHFTLHYITHLHTYMHIRTVHKVSSSAYSVGKRPVLGANHSSTLSAKARR
jgi:hypothetical protein